MRRPASSRCPAAGKRPSRAGRAPSRKPEVGVDELRPREAAHPDGLEAPRRQWAVATILIGILFTSLDATMVNVALPTIARDLGIDPGLVVWLAIAYSLMVVVTLLPFSVVSERIGSQRMYRLGVLVCMFSAIACALSTTFVGLLASRICQA